LAISLTGGNRNDVTQLLPLLDTLHARPVAGKVGRPRRKPDRVLGDRGYDHDSYRRLLWARGIKPIIARRGVAHGSGLGNQRWVIERGFAHLHNFRRLRIRYERHPEIHIAFLTLACAILCWRRLDSL
jgi:transposase